MKRIYLFLFFSIQLLNAYAQKKHLNCEDLRIIFSNNEFINHFHFTQKQDTLIFIDTFQIFKCTHLSINKKEIILSDKYTKEILKGVESYKSSCANFIVLQSIKKRNNEYNLIFWQPKDNAVMNLQLFIQKKPKIKVISIGVL